MCYREIYVICVKVTSSVKILYTVRSINLYMVTVSVQIHRLQHVILPSFVGYGSMLSMLCTILCRLSIHVCCKKLSVICVKGSNSVKGS